MKNNVYTFIFLIGSLFIFSCGSTSDTANTRTTNPHAEAHIQMHNEFQQEQIQKELDDQENKNIEPTKDQKQQFLLKKHQQGIDFYAVGNEPFWNIDMDFEKGFRFQNLDGLKFNTPAFKAVTIKKSNIIQYHTHTETGEMIIQLDQKFCSDTMADETFDYTVTVKIKLNKETDFTTYHGCGNYVPDYRLHNIWTIIEVDGIKVKMEDFKIEFPRLEINTGEEKVFGHDGCNSFNGSIKTENGKIIFGNLASTMMACIENAEISSKIGKILTGNKLNYTFKNNQLVFTKNNKIVMILKHID